MVESGKRAIFWPWGGTLPFGIREKDVLFSYVKTLRKTEYYSHKRIRACIYKAILLRKSNLYGIHIGINTCGMGLSIAHIGPIIINGESRIGKNLRIHVGANIIIPRAFGMVIVRCIVGYSVELFQILAVWVKILCLINIHFAKVCCSFYSHPSEPQTRERYFRMQIQPRTESGYSGLITTSCALLTKADNQNGILCRRLLDD